MDKTGECRHMGVKSSVNSKLHEGHRARLKEKFLNQGFNGMPEHEILEIILFYSIPRCNTNELAHALLNKFGTLNSVFGADIESLQEIPGIGSTTAFFLHIIPEIARIYELEKRSKNCDCLNSKNICSLMLSQYIGRKQECVYLALADTKGNLIDIFSLFEGNLSCAPIYIREIVLLAIKHNAKYAILSHNHPSGSCLPSINDVEASYKIKSALNSVDVQFWDHIIVTDEEVLSLRESKIVPDLFKI